jgi:hypothetical protein
MEKMSFNIRIHRDITGEMWFGVKKYELEYPKFI